VRSHVDRLKHVYMHCDGVVGTVARVPQLAGENDPVIWSTVVENVTSNVPANTLPFTVSKLTDPEVASALSSSTCMQLASNTSVLTPPDCAVLIVETVYSPGDVGGLEDVDVELLIVIVMKRSFGSTAPAAKRVQMPGIVDMMTRAVPSVA
jgi:hypothetical protein